MPTEKYITLAIHTYEKAVALRSLLEAHGIEAKFENVVVTGSRIVSAVRVKISERNLAHALRVIESGDRSGMLQAELEMAGEHGDMLIPVDFSAGSMLACRAGFLLARKLNLRPVLLNAYLTPYFSGNLGFDDLSSSITGVDENVEIEEAETGRMLHDESERKMLEFKKKLEKEQSQGSLPKLEFDSLVSEGVAEEVILGYCREHQPALVVMGTRGKDRKDQDLVGSVTAEVLDSCRVPVFTVPDTCNIDNASKLNKIVYFCNLDQNDILSVDTFMRIFEFPEVEMTLIPVNERAGKNVKEKTESLREYFSQNYPDAKFETLILSPKNFRSEFEDYLKDHPIDLLIVPNKKKNIFSRLFNPGIAHKMLFERDLPMVALPV